MREMVGGCCVCSDERGWAENPLVYCDGHGCSVAVHQACYGIVQVPTGPWFCRKCESQERAARVRCELCPHKDGALKRTDNGGWAHVVCALYIPEVQFANVLTMEPIVLQYVPHERYNKTCYICDDHGRESKAASGACMTCNRQGCRQAFHVTCAQMAGLLCEEEGPEADNVKYCGYCKYHFSKMKKMRPAAGNSSSSFCHTRRTSITTIPEKHGSHHHRQKRSHKEKLRQKERHKRPPPSSLNSSLSSSTGKLPSSHHGNKETGGKTKKLGNHSLHRSKKGAGSGTKSCSSSCSSSPFNTGGGSLSSAQDFLQYSSSSRLDWEREQGDEQATEETNEGNGGPWEVEEEEEDEEEEEEGEKYAKPSLLPPVLTMSDGPQNSPSYNRVESKGSSFEPKVTISTFGSIMRITSTGGLSGAAKVRKVTPGEYRPSKPNSKVHQTPSAISEEPDILEEQTMPPVSERRHGMNKKSRHGPGRPKGSRNREGREGKEHHISQSGTGYSVPPAPPCTSYPASISISTQNSFSIGSSSSLLSSGVYSSNKDPISLGGGVCSTTIASGLLSSHTSTHPYTSSSVTNTQVYTLPSSSYSLSSTRVCGSTLSAASPLSPLLSQTQSSLPEPHLEDHFVCRGSSPQESLSSQSPMSSLPLLFDQREGVDRGARGRPENVPLASSHIELLLEKHGNGEMGVNIVEMLKSLHSLQQENQRLQDQILSLTAKKERLQLLNVELAVPFPPQAHPAASSVLTTNQISFLSSPHDALNSKKSPPSKTCIMNENTLTNSEELPSGCPSRSSSSLSFQSTPPPQQSPASLSQQFVNGLGRALTGGLGSMSQAGNTTLPMVSGLMSSLTGSPQLSMNGMLGSLNGVIQSPNQNATQQPQLSVPTQQPSHQQTLSQSLQIPNSLTSSSLLSEQQKQFLLQQQHQLQQLLHSQHFTPEQQVVVYQMIQQQRRELQHFTLASSFTSSPSNPMVNQLATTSSLQGSQGNPFFNLQDNTQHKSGSGGDKGGEKN
ncbi:protein AF-17 isoform X2 [Paramormyrops kingsleyae]|uniref:protein AF-17 isoform X2 n=1 Tax=Paramormyrops kingsleyae TaxID=1676925 RepID=UPI003B97B337